MSEVMSNEEKLAKRLRYWGMLIFGVLLISLGGYWLISWFGGVFGWGEWIAPVIGTAIAIVVTCVVVTEPGASDEGETLPDPEKDEGETPPDPEEDVEFPSGKLPEGKALVMTLESGSMVLGPPSELTDTQIGQLYSWVVVDLSQMTPMAEKKPSGEGIFLVELGDGDLVVAKRYLTCGWDTLHPYRCYMSDKEGVVRRWLVIPKKQRKLRRRA